jgi:hypothetical protein
VANDRKIGVPQDAGARNRQRVCPWVNKKANLDDVDGLITRRKPLSATVPCLSNSHYVFLVAPFVCRMHGTIASEEESLAQDIAPLDSLCKQCRGSVLDEACKVGLGIK